MPSLTLYFAKSDLSSNFNTLHSYVYDDTKPNHAYRFIFRDSADATGFKKTILSLSIGSSFTWETGPEESGAIYNVEDTEPVPKRYKAIMLTSTRLDWTYSQLFYTYRSMLYHRLSISNSRHTPLLTSTTIDTDFKYDSIRHTVNFPQLSYSDYLSSHVDLFWKPPVPALFSECVKKFNQQTFNFPSATLLQAFMNALSNDFCLIFSRRAQQISTKAPSFLRSNASSSKGPTEVQLWRKGNVIRFASRWGDHVADKWITMALSQGDKGLKYNSDSNRVALPNARYARGTGIDLANVEAVRPREKGEGDKVATLTLAFATVRGEFFFLVDSFVHLSLAFEFQSDVVGVSFPFLTDGLDSEQIKRNSSTPSWVGPLVRGVTPTSGSILSA